MIVGIDLGTTNSLIGIWKDGEPRLIPNALGENLTPSVVGLGDDGKVIVGQGAKERLITHPHLTAANFKRFMGTARTFLLGKKTFRAEELSALVVKSLIRDAESELGEPVREAVITVPAYFNDVQRKATRAAGQLAGIKVERIINEPTAAALAYGRHLKDEEQQLLVFDLGGGTFDVSILELFDDVMEIHASAGNNFLGGEDFLMALIDLFLKHSELGERDLKNLDPILAMRIRSAAERAKRELSTRHETKVQVSWQDKVYEQTLSRHAFEEACRPVLDQLRAPMERALRDAKIPVKELDQIILVGGATKMPKITELVAKLFGRFPTSQLNPEEVVGLGAAVQAGLKARNQDLKEVVLTDVCPFTLGVEVSREIRFRNFQAGCFEPVIERNKVVPVSREIQLQTLQDFQKQIQVAVYQGESRQVKDNIHLGSLNVPVPQKPAGQETINVRFTYDINGLLEVEVTVLSTGVTKRMVIEENPGSLSQKEIENRLASLRHLKLHPRDQTENQVIMARAERWYQQSLGYEREMVGTYLDLFNHALDSQDGEAIEQAKAELDKLLSTLDVSPFDE